MATVSVRRSDVYPVGQSVGVYPAGSLIPDGPPSVPAIASGTVAANGELSITSAGIIDNTPYVLYAQVAGRHRVLRVRSTTTAHVPAAVWRAKVKARREAIGTTLPGAP